MNSPALFNKIAIAVYSTITSILSGINHIINHDTPASKTVELSAPPPVIETVSIEFSQPESTSFIRWQAIQQVLLSLLFWVILGLAAGFLLGMIRGG